MVVWEIGVVVPNMVGETHTVEVGTHPVVVMVTIVVVVAIIVEGGGESFHG